MKTECHFLDKNTVLLPVYAPWSSEPFNGALCPICCTDKNLNEVTDVIFSFHLFEFIYQDDYTDLAIKSLNYLSQSVFFPKLKQIYFLYGTAEINLDKIESPYILKKIHVNYFLLRSKFTEFYCTNYNVNDWEPKQKKALFLIGSPLRPNRLPILYEFIKNKQLDLLEYTLDFRYLRNYKNVQSFIKDESEAAVKISNFLFNGRINNLVNLLTNYRKIIDLSCDTDTELRERFPGNYGFETAAYLIPDQYFDTSLILCMETYFIGIGEIDKEPEFNIFTEKFFKAVLCKKPFIMSSHNDHYYSRLEKLGFRTFLEYTDVPRKVDIGNNPVDKTSVAMYTKVAYKRTKSFLANMEKYKNEIYEDTEHNYNLWKKLVGQEWEKLYECLPFRNIDSLKLNSMLLNSCPAHSFIRVS